MVTDTADESRREGSIWSTCPAMAAPQFRVAFTHLVLPRFEPRGWCLGPVARR
jgi:hypothetical protein